MRDATGGSGTVIWLVLLWLLVFAGSFLAFVLIPPSDMGFTRGLNRVGPWLLAQALALVFAIWALAAARRKNAPRNGAGFWIGHVPLFATLLEVAVLALRIGQALEP